MLKGSVKFDDLNREPVLEGDTVRLGSSYLSLHPSRYLQCLLVSTGERWFVTFRERVRGDAFPSNRTHTVANFDEYSRLYAEAILWPLDYITIEVLIIEKKLQIRSGAIGAAPVYCHCTKEQLTLSWDFRDFKHVSSLLDNEVAVAALSLSSQYSARQLLHGVHMLTERSTYTATQEGAEFRYPDAKDASVTIDGVSAAEYIERLDDELQHLLSLRPIHQDCVAVELSGGVDSAAVAVALKRTLPKFKTFGVSLSNNTAIHQAKRRGELTGLLNAIDFTVNFDDFEPDLAPDGWQCEGYNAVEEFYVGAFGALWNRAQSEGCDVIYKGFGGDELGSDGRHWIDDHNLDLRTEFHIDGLAPSLLTSQAKKLAGALRAFDAPASPVPHSCLIAQARHAPFSLSRGLWPVSPLSDPRIFDFCLRLPPQHRLNRDFLRAYANKCSGSSVFGGDYVKETFASYLPAAIARAADRIKLQLSTSCLSDFGLVDRSNLYLMIDHVCASRCEIVATQVGVAILLERFVRSLQGTN